MASNVGNTVASGVSKLASAAGDILTTPAKQVVEGVKSVVNGVIEVGQAVGYAMEGDWEAAGKSALSGVTNVIGGATSVALVASTVLVAFNPVAAAVVAGYAMYGGIAESGLGLAQNVVGQMTNDSGYAKKGTMHLVSGAVKAISAKGVQKLANKKIDTTQKQLEKLASEVNKEIEGKGPVVGINKHSLFKTKVDSLNNKNLQTETTFMNGNEVSYGTKGGIRVDVIERIKDKINVYDLKTGSAKLTESRIIQIQQSISPELPGIVNVFEIR